MEDEDVNIVLLEAFESLECLNFLPLVIHEQAGVSLPLGPRSNITMKAFSPSNNRSEDVDGSPFQMRTDRLNDGVLGLGDHGFPGLRAMLSTKFCVKEAKKVIDLCYGCDSGLSTPL